VSCREAGGWEVLSLRRIISRPLFYFSTLLNFMRIKQFRGNIISGIAEAGF
jgi:hypothetical protein